MGRLLLGLMVFGAGAWGLVSLQERGDRIRAEKTVVSAYVVGPRGTRHWKVVRVEYVFDRRLYRTDMLDIGWALPPESGEQVVLAIDPERPTQAAGPGLVSGSAWRYWYQPVGFGGIVIALVALWQLLRSGLRPKWEKSGPVVDRVLLHPAPVWAEKADGTVKTLILIPGETGLTWDEELPVRRLDAVTAELCCVPFLQMRLALVTSRESAPMVTSARSPTLPAASRSRYDAPTRPRTFLTCAD